MDLPADVQRPAPVGGHGQEAAAVWLQLPDRRRVRRIPHDLFHAGIPKAARLPINGADNGQSAPFRVKYYTNGRSGWLVTYAMISRTRFPVCSYTLSASWVDLL